ncbi:MAG TPA: SET domain-containing protein-lysine N-methyltransferase [Burkholderiaceae bacterium]|nr:SET domain-containing protein-lysine N-methyltransferase [Burkholderiaceae bacterium]
MRTVPGDIRFRVRVAPSAIDGQGLFAAERIAARRKIGELGGRVIRIASAARRVAAAKRIALVELDERDALDASASHLPTRYINHSCDPNAYMRVIGVHVEFYALRAIGVGEEITVDYGPTHHEGRLGCRCGASNCRGSI